VLGIIPFAGVDLGVYTTLKKLYLRSHPNNKKPGTLVLLGCGATAGVVGQTIAYPLDLVRRRMQVQGWGEANGVNYAYRGGITQTIYQIVSTEGVTALYRGLIPNYYKVVPAVSISFVVYEHCRELLDDVKV